MGGNGAFREIHSGSGNTPAKQQRVGRQHARREQLAARPDQAAGEDWEIMKAARNNAMLFEAT